MRSSLVHRNEWNGAETQTDCGGGCVGCAAGLPCAEASDCSSGICASGICQAPSCYDTIMNGQDSDINCGGYLRRVHRWQNMFNQL